jgi:hypothetical protein
MNRNLTRKPRLALESLERRALLSSASHAPPVVIHPVVARTALVAPIKASSAGSTAILNAIFGGAGSEFITLIRNEVHNLTAVLNAFMRGSLTQYSIPGLTVKTPTVQPLFTGHFYDQLAPTAAGAVVLKHNVLELGAIMRGPFHDPQPSYYVFALNRGAGEGLGPTFAARPGITPDLLVTLTVGAYGRSATGTITDFTNHKTTVIPSTSIKIKGPTLRVFLNTSQFPSAGWQISHYQFAFWTQTQPGTDITTVVDFAPEFSMIPIGVLKNVPATR